MWLFGTIKDLILKPKKENECVHICSDSNADKNVQHMYNSIDYIANELAIYKTGGERE